MGNDQSLNAMKSINGFILHKNVLRAGYAQPLPQKPNNQKPIKQNSLDIDVQKMEKSLYTKRIMMDNQKNNKKLTETIINLSGLPGNVSVQKIKRMFNGIGKCSNISLYEYEQFDLKFMNAVIKLDLEFLSVYNENDDIFAADLLKPIYS